MAEVKDTKDFKDDYDPEEFSDFETSVTREPRHNDGDTFKQRNDPQPILDRFRLQLMNAYLIKEETKDEISGEIKTKTKIKRRKNTKPKANKQGIEDIISYLEKIINNHVVMGNLTNIVEYNNRMRIISDDITIHFVANREDWGITIKDVDILIRNAIQLIDLFLTRTLFNKERDSYTEGFKETRHTESKPKEKKGVFESMKNFVWGN